MRRFVQAFLPEGLPRGLDASAAAALAEAPERYNIASRGSARVLFDRGDGLRVEDFEWGLVPSWSRQPETPYTTVTARLERAARSRVFSRAWEKRRCVVPMSGYYKWDRATRPPRPYFIQAASGDALFAAGLWDRWPADTPEKHSFAILTHENRAIPAPLVPDGPVFLPPDAVEEWIAGPRFPARFLLGMPQPSLVAYRVSKRIRRRDVDDYTLLEPADPAEDAPVDPLDDEPLDEDD